MAATEQHSLPTQEPPVQLPRVTIKFCVLCKWLLRSAWYAQELLSTFSTSLGEVTLVPATGGVFTIEITHSPTPSTINGELNDNITYGEHPPKPQTTRLWDRKTDGGFPETKILKQLVRNIIDPSRDLGHVDRHVSQIATNTTTPQAQLQNLNPPTSISSSSDERTEETTADLLSQPPESLMKNEGKDRQTRQQTPAEVSAMQTAEKMVAEIMSSFAGRRSLDNDSEEIGGGSRKLNSRQEKDGGEIVAESMQRETSNIDSAIQGCEDCG